MTLGNDGLLKVVYDSASTDDTLSKVDEDLAQKLKEQAARDQSEGGGFDTSRTNGLGFLAKGRDVHAAVRLEYSLSAHAQGRDVGLQGGDVVRLLHVTLNLGLVTTGSFPNLDTRVTYTGFGDTKATSKVRDRTAFTVKFDVNSEVGNFGFGVGYGFVGSENTTNHQVYGNVRYRF